jgi:hypothetical protein
MIFSDGFFSLFDPNIVPITDIGLLIGICIACYSMLYRRKIRYTYGGCAIFAIILSLTASIQCWIITGQNIILGLRPQRMYILCWLFYFVLLKLIIIEKLYIQNIVKIIRYSGYIILLLYIIQFLIGENYMFLNVKFNYRYGTIRLYGSTLFVDLLYIISLSEIVKGKRIKLKNLIEFIIIMLYVIIIRKGRMMLFSYLAVFILSLLLWKGASYKKIIIFLLALFGVSLIINDEMIGYIMQAFTNSSNDENVIIRISAVKYYFEMLKQHPILGGGFVNTTYSAAAEMAGVTKNYYFVDNGFLGYLYQYGLLGGLWNIFLYSKLIKDGIKLIRLENDYFVFLYVFFSLLGIRAGIWNFYYFSTFKIVLTCIIVDCYKN